ncbi:MAG: hypothetical protein ABI411_12025 [Tahibacter sp.]
MLKICLISGLLLVAGSAHAQSAGHGWGLTASGDGSAKLVLQADGTAGVLRVRADFGSDVLVKSSEEAHSRGRWFVGEIRVDGKVCSDARARLHAEDGRAHAHASTSCSIGVSGDKAVTVEAVVVKSDDVDRDEVRVEIAADKSGSH